jgi:hypothetical protein
MPLLEATATTDIGVPILGIPESWDHQEPRKLETSSFGQAIMSAILRTTR